MDRCVSRLSPLHLFRICLLHFLDALSNQKCTHPSHNSQVAGITRLSSMPTALLCLFYPDPPGWHWTATTISTSSTSKTPTTTTLHKSFAILERIFVGTSADYAASHPTILLYIYLLNRWTFEFLKSAVSVCVAQPNPAEGGPVIRPFTFHVLAHFSWCFGLHRSTFSTIFSHSMTSDRLPVCFLFFFSCGGCLQTATLSAWNRVSRGRVVWNVSFHWEDRWCCCWRHRQWSH